MTTPPTRPASSASVGPPGADSSPNSPRRARSKSPCDRPCRERARGAHLPPAGRAEAEPGSGNAPPNPAPAASVRSPSRRRGSGGKDPGTRPSPDVAPTPVDPATRSPLPPDGTGSTPSPGSPPSFPALRKQTPYACCLPVFLYPMAVFSFLGGSCETPLPGFRKGTPPFPSLHAFEGSSTWQLVCRRPLSIADFTFPPWVHPIWPSIFGES